MNLLEKKSWGGFKTSRRLFEGKGKGGFISFVKAIHVNFLEGGGKKKKTHTHTHTHAQRGREGERDRERGQ